MGYTINLNDTDPVAPVGKANVKWQKGVVPADPAQPVPVSAYVDTGGSGGLAYTTDTGAVNAYAGTFTPTPSLTAGLTLALKVANTNTGASTLSPNGLGTVAIKKLDGTTALVAGDLVAGQIYYFTYDGTNFQLVAVPGVLNSDAVVVRVNQASHGFTTGKAVYYNASLGWTLAKADAASTLGVGVVFFIDANNFYLVLSGVILGMSGLTAGQYYFVSDASAGLLVITEPTTVNHYSNPLLFALSSVSGIVLPFRPSANEPLITTIQKKTGNYTAAAGDIVLCDTSLGGFTVTLPASSLSIGLLPITIKKTSTDSNVLSIASTGGDTLDGNASPISVVTPKESLTFNADGGTDWPVT